MNEGIILQDLRDFTVQIRRPGGEAIVGTGIAVSLDGEIVTCAHVVKTALGAHPREANGAEVGVYFPQARGDEDKARTATVAACFPTHDDDVVLLRVDGPLPLGPEQMPKLGTANDSHDHGFRSYGYAPAGNRLSRYAHGDIMGPVEIMAGTKLHEEPIELRTRNVRRGMSGGPVLDIERNLVVGLVTAYWSAEGDPDNIAYATNGKVLTFEPLNLPLQDMPLPKQAAAQPQQQYRDTAKQLTHIRPESQFHAAPPPLAEWVGRTDLLKGLTRDYDDPDRRVTGLIGFGGEGESSLARRWVDMLADLPEPPTAIFWWGFYENRNVDEFFESALCFISGGRINQSFFRSSSAKAQAIAAMLANGRYVFVLDGLEVLQHQEGDEYGTLTSPDLQTFLELFAGPGHASFCLVTSRAPLLDLMAYTSYNQRDVGPVTPADGRALLRALGVKGQDDELDPVVTQWDGHALTLSLLGSYLAWRFDGDVAHADEFDPIDAEEVEASDAPGEAKQRYAHVHRVLRRYDEHLSEAERAFLTLFSAFRTPVAPDAFVRVFRAVPDTGDRKGTPLQGTLAALDDDAFDALVARLVGYLLVRHNEDAGTYTTHPLVRNHYLARLTSSGQAEQTHDRLKAYYLDLAGDTPYDPTMEQLAPLIETVYHACRAGTYDAAYDVYRERIRQHDRFYDVHVLGAYETSVNIMQQFFPDGDTSQEPQVSKASDTSWILNAVGMYLTSLGRLDAAVPFYERVIEMDQSIRDWGQASVTLQNLAELNCQLGRLDAGAAAATQALALARRAEDKRGEQWSLEYVAWAKHLLGESEEAGELYHQVEAMQQEWDSSKRYLYSLDGIHHAEHLRRASEADYARRVMDANLEICERNRWAFLVTRCYRVLGELDAADGQHDTARIHFDTALSIARGISMRAVLNEALLARGRWAARLASPELPQAFSDLREALGYATEGGYRIYEADIRIALAWANLADGDAATARQEATRARTLSEQMGYHWGLVDADEVLEAIG